MQHSRDYHGLSTAFFCLGTSLFALLERLFAMRTLPPRALVRVQIRRQALALVVLGSSPLLSIAQAQDLKAVYGSALLVSSSSHRQPSSICASGLRLAPGLLLTSLHVVRSICDETDCRDLQIARSPSPSPSLRDPAQPLPAPSEAQLLRVYPARDLALIKFNDPWEQTAPLPIRAPQAGEPVNLVGFPKCGHGSQGAIAQLSQGKVESTGSILVQNSALTSFGGSGSPLFGADGAVIGIVAQATPNFEALKSFLITERFPNSAVRLDAITASLFDAHGPLVYREDALLVTHYREQTAQNTALGGLVGAVDFTARVEATRQWALLAKKGEASSDLSFWAYLGELPTAGLPLSPSLSSSELNERELIYLYNLVTHGEQRGALQPLAPEHINVLSVRFGNPWIKAHEVFRASSTLGLTLLALREASRFMIPVLLTIILWGVSLGVVGARTHGSLVRKTFVALFAGVFLWPLSLLAWAFWQRSRARNHIERQE